MKHQTETRVLIEEYMIHVQTLAKTRLLKVPSINHHHHQERASLLFPFFFDVVDTLIEIGSHPTRDRSFPKFYFLLCCLQEPNMKSEFTVNSPQDKSKRLMRIKDVLHSMTEEHSSIKMNDEGCSLLVVRAFLLTLRLPWKCDRKMRRTIHFKRPFPRHLPYLNAHAQKKDETYHNVPIFVDEFIFMAARWTTMCASNHNTTPVLSVYGSFFSFSFLLPPMNLLASLFNMIRNHMPCKVV
mmetsp:Transcript_264/g.542  ORF Transcript_264/g.542 Transcript_264/m.542 type:complete len:240 (+) Transcript_264:1892-2611(+)